MTTEVLVIEYEYSKDNDKPKPLDNVINTIAFANIRTARRYARDRARYQAQMWIEHGITPTSYFSIRNRQKYISDIIEPYGVSY